MTATPIERSIKKRLFADVAIWLSAAWAVWMTYRYGVELPPAPPIAMIYLFLADVNYIFFGIGISMLLLLSSNWFGDKITFGLLKAVKGWICVAVCFFTIWFLITCISLFASEEWGDVVSEIAYSESVSDTVGLPFMPLNLQLIENLSPFEASTVQLCLVSFMFAWYGCLVSALSIIARSRVFALFLCTLTHFMGLYALSTWPPWIGIVPQSYSFLQNYNAWSPIPYPNYDSAWRGLLVITTSVSAACALSKALEKRRRHG